MLLVLSLLLAQAPLAGTWTGTSVCLQGKPVCRDEQVVYHVSTAVPDSAVVTMNKLVGGREEEMAVLRCGVTAARVTCPMPPQFRPGTWWFDRRGEALDGGLTVPDGSLFRRVHVERRG
jgi:hypothetical protein